MIVGKLFTIALEDHESGEVGQFELPVTVPEQLFLQSGDKSGLVKRQFAAHLANAIMDTKVPIEYWRGAIDERVANNCNLPRFLNFGVKK